MKSQCFHRQTSTRESGWVALSSPGLHFGVTLILYGPRMRDAQFLREVPSPSTLPYDSLRLFRSQNFRSFLAVILARLAFTCVLSKRKCGILSSIFVLRCI